MRIALAVAFSLVASGTALANPTTQDPTKAPAGTYVLDPKHASLLVKVPHLGGFSKYTMRFNRLDGSFTYDPANWRAAKATISVDPTSIDTGDPAFNKQTGKLKWMAAPQYRPTRKH